MYPLPIKLIDRVRKIVEKEGLIEADERVLACLSGGIDSTVMLYLLIEVSNIIPFHIGVVHVNHGLRGEEADRDERFVKMLSEKHGLPYHIERIDVTGHARRSGLSIQHAGRDLRYMVFNRIADTYNYNRIAIAHNLDDQVETFILRVLKGTGLHGLSSIPIKRDRVIRPLLYCTRPEIDAYAKAHSIPFIFDSSNNKTVYERNFIRLHIIPQMERLNPKFREKVFQLIMDITAINRLYDEKAEGFIKEGLLKDGEALCLMMDGLKGLEEETRFRIFAHVLTECGERFIPLREHIRLIEKLLFSKRPNISIKLPGDIRVVKVYKQLRFTKANPPDRVDGVFPVNSGRNWIAPLRLTLHVSFYDRDHIDIGFLDDKMVARLDGDRLKDLSVRTFRPGDRFFPLGMDRPVKLKDFFISQKVPIEERRLTPLLLSDDNIVWVIGYRIDDRYKVTGETRRIAQVVATKEM